MSNFIHSIGIKIAAGLIALASILSPVKFGDYNPTGGQTYRLQSSVGTTDSSMTLTSFKEPVSNIKYTMSYLNSSIEYATIDPSNSTSKEFVSFTGITQNSDNTATLTGVTRGLGFSYPYTASTTLAQPHSGQSIFILSNPPQLTNQYYNLNNNATTSPTSMLVFSSTTPPRLDFVGLQGTGTYISTTSEFATIAYVNKTGAGVNVNANETTNGVSQLATGTQVASSTSSGSTGGRLVIPASLATSSPSAVCGVGCVATTQNNGKLHQGFLDLTQTYLWTGQATSTANATSTAIIVANTLIATSSFSTPSIILNGYFATSSIMSVFQDSGSYSITNTSTTTLATAVIPANSISNNGSFTYDFYVTGSGSNGVKCAQVDFGSGTATSTIMSGCVNMNTANSGIGFAFFHGTIRNINSLSTQIVYGKMDGRDQNTGFTSFQYATSSIASVNTGNKSFIAVDGIATGGGDTMQIKGITITKLP